ncbi:hypothetical protein [Paenibacillus popilliae]|uniref:Uncharacterized protein n=1 Tax=Paenibacillus popilliae ATCC 14706 TaxID=1212764 RepID=M9LGL1_PAEPP|nr:hypothetical protein [Paenibacillus popilliae]GAC41690.1 hypothetical protein PPOP_1041 [Paenibacillus popilliae ATCC 14706]
MKKALSNMNRLEETVASVSNIADFVPNRALIGMHQASGKSTLCFHAV